MARKSKLDVYVDSSVQLIPEVVVKAKRNANVKNKKAQEEPLYLDRV